MNKWYKLIALLTIPAVLGFTSCAGAGAPESQTASTEATESQNASTDATEDQTSSTDVAEGQETSSNAAEDADGVIGHDLLVEETDEEEDAPKQSFDGQMHFEDGAAQPMLNYSSQDTDNKESEILRLCVYVETDHDTDGDGKADLVKAYLQIPRSAVEGKYKAAAIYDPTPYAAGLVEKARGVESYPYCDESFDYNKLYEPGAKREPAGTINTLDAALEADKSGWIYTTPGSSNPGYYSSSMYDYYLIRGFAVVDASGIGTYGSEGFELSGLDLERDSHKCVVEWLAGDRVAYTDRENNIAIEADWCNGNIAMMGVSYGGTLPFEVATTGVKGLKTIIPYAGISNWYDYTNSQGVSTYAYPRYTDFLSSFNAGALFEDLSWLVPNETYGAWINQIAKDETAANGNYTEAWSRKDYTKDYAGIKCSALIFQGLNDFNVTTKQADLMYKSFKKAGQTAKIVLHQDAHNVLRGKYVGDQLSEELMNKWLSHYLYDVDNGIEDMAEATVQSNLDGTYKNYDSWGEAQ